MRKGYTLIEMAIVLIIISILAGAVLEGLSVLRQSQLRSVTEDLNHYQQALRTFYDRYNQMPGDMANATSFWGADAGCPSTAWDGTPKKATCGGDGNGKISPQDYDNDAPTNGDFTESFRAWQQLYDAGFTDQAMVGTRGPAGSEMQPGLNVPQAGYGEVGYMLYYLQCTGVTFSGAAGACIEYFPAKYGHVLEAGIPTGWMAAGGYGVQPFLNPQEAWSIDSKIDDGNPTTGKVLAPTTVLESNCTTGNAYQLSSSMDNACSLLYITGL